MSALARRLCRNYNALQSLTRPIRTCAPLLRLPCKWPPRLHPVMRSIASSVSKDAEVSLALDSATGAHSMGVPTFGDTIYQLSSGLGVHSAVGVALIRVSGPRAADALLSLTRRTKMPAPRVATMVNLYRSAETNPTADRTIDSDSGPLDSGVLALSFPGPRSFTGEDVVELHVHGNRVVVKEVLAALGTLPGLRLAEPGEFTRRAFVNGKLDLTQVEGLADLLGAETEHQRAQAVRQMSGHLGRLYDEWRGELAGCLAYLEAVIDFAEDEADVGEAEIIGNVLPRVSALQRSLAEHLHDGRRGELVRQGVSVAIIGPPNAGKSTLINTLAQRDVAIVSSVPGTTRDIVEVSLNLGGYPVVVADTAGLRDTDDVVEREGVRRARSRLDKADLKLAVFDAPSLGNIIAQLRAEAGAGAGSGSLPAPSELELDAITRALVDRDTVVVFSKADLLHGATRAHAGGLAPNRTHTAGGRGDNPTPLALAQAEAQEAQEAQGSARDEALERFLTGAKAWFPEEPAAVCLMSCQSTQGMAALLAQLQTQVKLRLDRSDSNEPVITRLRHRTHIRECLDELEAFQAERAQRGDLVLAAEHLRLAMRALGKIVGRVDVEELLDVIFRDFCIGNHMERTCEQLLTMGSDAPGAAVARQAQQPQPRQETPAQQTPQARSPAAGSPAAQNHAQPHGQAPDQHQSRSLPAAAPRPGAGVQLDRLADDFLRPPSYFVHTMPAAPQATPPGLRRQRSQVEEDAIVAQLLADEMFMQDLARNPERYLGRQSRQPRSQRSARPPAAPLPTAQPRAQQPRAPPGVRPQFAATPSLSPAPAPAPAGAGADADSAAAPVPASPARGDIQGMGGGGGGDGDEVFQRNENKVASLGDSARKKLAYLASVFKRNKQKPAPGTTYNSLPTLDDELDADGGLPLDESDLHLDDDEPDHEDDLLGAAAGAGSRNSSRRPAPGGDVEMLEMHSLRPTSIVPY